MNTELFALGGKVALVTGSSRGIGLAMARSLGQAGAHVVLNGRHADSLEKRVRELSEEGLSASQAPFDVVDEPAVKAAIEEVVRRRGSLDILLNNAGIVHRDPVSELDTEHWRRVIETNLTSCFVLAREAARPMIARGWGRIVITASIMSFLARPGIAAYVSSKAALAGLTRVLAVELGPKGVTCNAIAPGYFVTDLTSGLVNDPEFDAFIRRRVPLGRWAEPRELGGVAVFLASDAASFVNGHVLTVDGGLTASL